MQSLLSQMQTFRHGRSTGERDAPVESRRQRQRRLDYQGWARRQFREHRGSRFVTTQNVAYGSYTAMTVTNLQSLLSDQTDVFAGWQSARVSNLSTLAEDYEVIVDLSTTAHAPSGDAAAYVYIVPWTSTDGGTTWITGGNFGTTTLPSGSEATANISDPNSMKGPISMPYKITSQRLQCWFSIKQFCGEMPGGWSLAIRAAHCAAGASQGLSTGCVVAYQALTRTNT